MEKLSPRQGEQVTQSHPPPKPELTGIAWVFHFWSCTHPSSRWEHKIGHMSPHSHLQPPPIEANLFAIPRTNAEVTISGASILLAAASPAVCLLCTQRQPELAHVFRGSPPPPPLWGPTGNSAKIIISNWGFVQSASKTSSPFRIIRPCY